MGAFVGSLQQLYLAKALIPQIAVDYFPLLYRDERLVSVHPERRNNEDPAWNQLTPQWETGKSDCEEKSNS